MSYIDDAEYIGASTPATQVFKNYKLVEKKPKGFSFPKLSPERLEREQSGSSSQAHIKVGPTTYDTLKSYKMSQGGKAAPYISKYKLDNFLMK